LQIGDHTEPEIGGFSAIPDPRECPGLCVNGIPYNGKTDKEKTQ
jgi:hypothetical protein